MPAPLVLDFDASVGALAGATRLDLRGWQERIRFGSTRRTFARFVAALLPQLPPQHGTVLLGSGDYHHLSWPLIERASAAGPCEVVVFDNHPDNMRFPWGIHCGSWVRRVAALRGVTRVHVLGISSHDVGLGHAWENHLAPLWRGRLEYWTVGVAVGWARRLGLRHAVHAFDSPAALLERFAERQQGATTPLYLSIDKDVLDPAVARTNWDQGRFSEADLMRGIDLLAGRVIGSDITGEVSTYRYASWWKRQLSALDAQPAIDPAQLAQWQAQQHALNLRLLARIDAARR